MVTQHIEGTRKFLTALKGIPVPGIEDLKLLKSLIHSLAYSTAHRRSKKRDQRSLMITRINAASRKCGISYSSLIHNLKASNIELDRKTLSLLAYSDFGTFEKVVEESKLVSK